MPIWNCEMKTNSQSPTIPLVLHGMANSVERATCWSLTINNPTDVDKENIDLAIQKGWKVLGQLEQGENGTMHYQLMLRTPQVRFSAVKKAFPRAHVEVARDPVALTKYVSKEDTRVKSLDTSSHLYPSLHKFWDLITEQIYTDDAYLEACAGNECWGAIDYIDRLRKRGKHIDWFDNACGNLIEDGYRIDMMCVNPAIRALWKTQCHRIIVRSIREKELTDNEHNNALSTQDTEEHAEVPTTHEDCQEDGNQTA